MASGYHSGLALVPRAEIEFSHVFPVPSDINPAAIGQIIVTQQPFDSTRSVVVSIYDTARPTPSPFTFAMTHGSVITLRSLLDDVRLAQACPPRVLHNECSLWLGTTLIPATRQAFCP